MFILNLIIFILVLGLIIVIHELGHYFFAKKAGILCHEFAIGMGPALYQKRKGETIYSIRAIPIGGYVSMAGESIKDALISEGDRIGIKLDQKGKIKEIHLTNEIESEWVGKVIAFDLYGKDMSKLFIDLEIDGNIEHYEVDRDAIYHLPNKKEMWITPAEKSFESKSVSKRFWVIFAGPMMNFILAFLIFFIIGWFATKPNMESTEIKAISELSSAELIGLKAKDQIMMINGIEIDSWAKIGYAMSQITDTNVELTYKRDDQIYVTSFVPMIAIQSAGFSNTTKEGVIYDQLPIIGRAFSRGESHGKLQTGDRITSIVYQNETHSINSWTDILTFFRSVEDIRGTIKINYIRNGLQNSTSYDMISESALNRLGAPAIATQIGVTPTSNFDFVYSLTYPVNSFVGNINQVLQTLGLLFDRNENLGIGDLSGPIGIFTLVSRTTADGVLAVLGFTAFLSINIGFLNLLPIPALDGGRLVFLGIEAVTKKPLPRRLENTINNVMLFVLLGLFVFVSYNDILRLIRG
jgi:regulator of sigma E protease